MSANALAAEGGPPSGTRGLPPGMTALPPSIAGNSSGTMPPKGSSHVLTDLQVHILIGMTSMLLVLCLAAVGGRLVARRISRIQLEADDWTCVMALVTFIGLCVEQLLLAKYELLILSQPTPDPHVLRVVGQSEFASQLTYPFVTCVAKASLLMLYRRVFTLRVKWYRVAWWTNAALVAVLFIALIITTCIQCQPISLHWTSPVSCIPHQTTTSVLGFLNAAIDSAILILPLRMVWALQMSRKQKIAVCSIFGLGFIGVAVSLARAISIASPNLYRGGGLALILWSTTEPAVGLICSCLPVLRPLYTNGFAKLGSSRGWSSYAWKRSGSSGTSALVLSRQKDIPGSTKDTSRLASTSLDTTDKVRLKETETQRHGACEEMQNITTSPVDKPLPPAYSHGPEDDTGYHTWSWNLLSKPRNENVAPKLTRSPTLREMAPSCTQNSAGVGNRALLRGARNTMSRLFSTRPSISTSRQGTKQTESNRSMERHSPSQRISNPASQRQSPSHSPISETDSWASPSLVPTKHFARGGMPQHTVPDLPTDSFTIHPQGPVAARVKTTRRRSTPSLKIMTDGIRAPSPINPISLAKITPQSGDHVEKSTRIRSASEQTDWPSTGLDGTTEEEVKAAILRGHAT